MEEMRLQLIADAVLPNDSKLIIPVSKKVQEKVSHAAAYGAEMYCLLLNDSFFNPWVDLPVLTFMHASGTGSYPSTKLPETRHVLGIEANVNANTVVLGHFMYTKPAGKVIRIDIFSIDPDFKATLVQVISTETECAGSGLLGTFASPQPNMYIALWGDLSNDDFFDTFKVHQVSTTPVQTNTAALRTKSKSFKLNFLDLGELYPASNDAVYNCHSYGADHKYPNCLAVLVYYANLKNIHEKPRIVFHTVIKLSFDLYYSEENATNSTIPRYSAVIMRMKKNEDGTMVCLVRVMVKVPESSTTVNATASANTRAYKEQFVYLLLSMPHHTVLDMFVPVKYEECTIDVTGEHIVRFVATPAAVEAVVNSKAADSARSEVQVKKTDDSW
eukprot:gene9024-10654_t